MTVSDLRQRPASEWMTRVTELLSAESDWLGTVDPEVARDATRRGLDALVTDDANHILSFESGGEILAAAAFGPSRWDSDHFGFPVHRVQGFAVAPNLHDGDSAARGLVNEGIVPRLVDAELVFARVSLDAITEANALEAAGFRIMDVQVTWMWRGTEAPRVDPCVREAVAADAAPLSAIAGESMRHAPTHFRTDRRLDQGRVDALYERWAANSVTRSAADHVVVAEMDGHIAGFATAKLVGTGSIRYGTIPLVAVTSGARGRSVGSMVVSAAVASLVSHGVTAVLVGTQANNFRAARLYGSLGFRPVHAAATLHRWSAPR